jgi:ABC-2 type transport system ATP-binding protein
MEDNVVISVESLSKGYKTKKVLNDLSFSVEKGDFHGILGKNGAGKSTLIECLYGALKPDKDRVSVLGLTPFPLNRKLLAEIGIQEQRGAFIYRATVKEHLETLARIFDCDLKRVDMLINRMGLQEVKDQRARLLSGGQQQKIALAAAVLNRPKV